MVRKSQKTTKNPEPRALQTSRYRNNWVIENSIDWCTSEVGKKNLQWF